MLETNTMPTRKCNDEMEGDYYRNLQSVHALTVESSIYSHIHFHFKRLMQYIDAHKYADIYNNATKFVVRIEGYYKELDYFDMEFDRAIINSDFESCVEILERQIFRTESILNDIEHHLINFINHIYIKPSDLLDNEQKYIYIKAKLISKMICMEYNRRRNCNWLKDKTKHGYIEYIHNKANKNIH